MENAGAMPAAWPTETAPGKSVAAGETWEWRLGPWITVLGAACIAYGVLWDISWHATIGRDTFWTPAHLLIHAGGLIGGLLGGWMILAATFWRREAWRDRTVGILGLRGPLGSFVAVWGAMAMLTSAPFDDWWHNAYGLDVKILSPPHTVLAAGMYGVVTGALLVAISARNRTQRRSGDALMLAAGAIQLALASILLTEFSFPNSQRTATFYLVSAGMYPAFLAGLVRQRPVRFSATMVALGHAFIVASMVWLLPLFPAEPKLAPIFNRVTHMVPPAFPLLLVAPALLFDLFGFAMARWRTWLGDIVLAFGCAVLFAAAFLPVQWYFSEFLLGPGADNAFFAGNRYMSFAARGTFKGRFWGLEEDPVRMATIGWMLLIGLASSGFGVLVGRYLSKVRR